MTITVALRVWHNPRWAGNGGGPTRESQLGTMDRIEHVAREHAAAQAWSMTAALNLALIELIAAIVALAMYSLRRSEREYFWFTVVSLCEAFVYILNFYGATHPVRIYVAWSSYAVDFALRGVAGLFFYRTLLRGRTDLLFRISIFAIAPLSAEYWLLLSNSIPPGWWFCTSIVLELPGFIWISLLLLKGLRQRLPDARLLIIPLLMYAVVYLLELTDSFLKQLDRPGLPFSIYLLETPIRISYDDLSELLFLLAMLAILIARFARTSRNQDRISSEFEAARTLQHVLIPEDIPRIPNLTIATAYHPAMEVGGDFFQILPLPTGDTLIILGDVAGKGLPAAMTVSLLVGALRTLAEQTHSPAEILAGLNRRLLGRGSGFTTCLILRISPNGLLTLASAGHLPPYLNGHELPTEASLPLGLSPDTTFIEQTRTLSPKHHLTLLTDGVPEAQCRHELLGFPRTEALSLEPAATIAQVARAFGQTDDITVLSVIFAIA